MHEAKEGAERLRLADTAAEWKKWGPYLSERQWGTVREDYSNDGNAWAYFTHDQARSRAYRWGEDGLAGISDDHQILCFALALWNGRDPILKERLFGLTNSEGNHGEDVKEYYFYLDSTPTHSYMKYLYKYPQAAYPYDDLVQTNRRRSRNELEYELLDTGIFNEDRYFDVFVEYAKAGPNDLLIRITAFNRGPQPADLHLLPTLWFRNTWSWQDATLKPELKQISRTDDANVIATRITDPMLQAITSDYRLYCEGDPPILFTENETNHARLFGGQNASPYVKDGINNFIVNGQHSATNPGNVGTKAAAWYPVTIGPRESRTERLRLTKQTSGEPQPFKDFDQIFAHRLREADEFYDAIAPDAVKADKDRFNVMRQAFAGMLWSKQYFYYDLTTWLKEHQVGVEAPAAVRARIRNGEWFHMHNDDIISMPDKWEYPWFAAWDLAFHMLPFAMLDPDFAKSQLDLMLRRDYIHPNGQIPAYEWNFGDVNPPVHAYATMQIYLLDKARNGGKGDLAFLRHAFSKLLMNFTWWVNRKDREGNNVFEGGFLGLDNIGVFDRSAPLPTGGHLEQADGTAWMVFFSQQMLRISVELALHDPAFQEYVEKFFEHTIRIAAAMDRVGVQQDDMWDEEDGFFYDVLRLPGGTATRLKVRSMVGLLPLMAVSIFERNSLEKLPDFLKSAREFLTRNHEFTSNIHMPNAPGVAGRRMLSIVNESKLRKILTRMLDENEFYGPYGIRALSRCHLDHPFVFRSDGQEYRVSYLPGDSDSGMFGGNSNWRGPVWMPVNMMIYIALLRMAAYYGDSFKIECPTGSGKMKSLFEVAQDLAERLIRTFQRDEHGRRPVYGGADKFQNDPYWRDYILFYEYFHGDNGAGIGASHQTGWTGCIARMITMHGWLTREILYAPGAEEAAMRALIDRTAPQRDEVKV